MAHGKLPTYSLVIPSDLSCPSLHYPEPCSISGVVAAVRLRCTPSCAVSRSIVPRPLAGSQCLEQKFDFHGRPQRKSHRSYSRPGMLARLAKDLREQLAGAVGDLGLIVEVRH